MTLGVTEEHGRSVALLLNNDFITDSRSRKMVTVVAREHGDLPARERDGSFDVVRIAQPTAGRARRRPRGLRLGAAGGHLPKPVRSPAVACPRPLMIPGDRPAIQRVRISSVTASTVDSM